MSVVVDDVLTEGLRLVICGTALGPESARARQYYAGPGNRFWGVMAETGLTPRLLAPAEYRELLELGIGLTDVVKDQFGVDVDIRFEDAHRRRLEKTVLHYHPKILCFNGKRAAREGLGRRRVAYGLQKERIGRCLIFVAPSTSAAARRWWDERIWHDLAELVRGAEEGS